MSRLIPAALLILLFGCSGQTPRCEAPTAAGLVQAVDAERVLHDLLNNVLMRTETAPMIMAHNPSGFATALSPAIDAAVERYGPRWRANMIIAYRESLGPTQLKQACDAFDQGDSSGYARLTQRVTERQRQLSTPLITAAASDALAQMMPLLR